MSGFVFAAIVFLSLVGLALYGLSREWPKNVYQVLLLALVFGLLFMVTSCPEEIACQFNFWGGCR